MICDETALSEAINPKIFCTTSSPKKKPRLRADQQANRKRKYRNNLENSGCRLKRRVDKGLQESQQKTVGSRSISRVLSWTTIPLGMLLPACSSSLPGSNASHAMRFPIWPCFGWGLPCRPCYHVRGELLPRPGFRPTAPAIAGAPFHPCLCRQNKFPCST